jgi:hypothetical protein
LEMSFYCKMTNIILMSYMINYDNELGNSGTRK